MKQLLMGAAAVALLAACGGGDEPAAGGGDAPKAKITAKHSDLVQLADIKVRDGNLLCRPGIEIGHASFLEGLIIHRFKGSIVINR